MTPVNVIRCDDPRVFFVHPRGKPELGGELARGRLYISDAELHCITGFVTAPRDCDCGAFRLARLSDPPFASLELPALKAAALAAIPWDRAEWMIKRQPHRDHPPGRFRWHVRLELVDPRLSSPLRNGVAVLGTSPSDPGSGLPEAIRLLRTWVEEEVLRRLDLVPPEEPEG